MTSLNIRLLCPQIHRKCGVNPMFRLRILDLGLVETFCKKAKDIWLTGVTNADGTRQIGHVLRRQIILY